jgi:NAD(P)-dependent dehydrogenase (short-subunit alcohol dehydrogenase family)
MSESPDSYFSQQHAVVTGGASGIGAAIAKLFSARGMRLTLMGRNQKRLDEMAGGLNAFAQPVDITKAADVQHGFSKAVEANGAVSILVNNAGSAKSGAFAKMSDDMWDRMLAVNLTGTYTCTRAVVNGMARAGHGRIINIASTASLKGYAYVTAYCAAKHGVLGLTRALALEMAGKGVTVNAVCPGYTDTDLVSRSLDKITRTTGMDRDVALAELVKNNPQGRLITPEEVADAVMWLCGPGAASVTGQAIAVAGGEVYG